MSMTKDQAYEAVASNRVKAPYLSRWVDMETDERVVVYCHAICEETNVPQIVFYERFAGPGRHRVLSAETFLGGRFCWLSDGIGGEER